MKKSFQNSVLLSKKITKYDVSVMLAIQFDNAALGTLLMKM